MPLTHEQRFHRRQQMAAAVQEGKSMPDVAQQFGVSITTVVNACIESRVRPTNQNWARLNAMVEQVVAGRPATVVAIEHGVSASTLYKACERAGVGLKRGRRSGATNHSATIVSIEEWNAVDWTQRDTDIAAKFGVTRERVRQVRRMLNKPNAKSHREQSMGMLTRKWLADNRTQIEGLPITDIRQLCPFKPAYQTIKRFCDRMRIRTSHPNAGQNITKENLKTFCDEVTGRLETPCWEWRFSKLPTGYGSLGSRRYVHRLAYTLFHGPVADHLWVLHHCDNPKCANPAHLYAGTAKDNARDRAVRGRNGNCKLTPEQAKEILELRRMGGFTIQRLATKYSVSTTAIMNVLEGKTWRFADEQIAYQESQQVALAS